MTPGPAAWTSRRSTTRPHWLWGSRGWELVAGDLGGEGREELSRLVAGGLSEAAAARLVLSSYKGRKHGMVTRSFRASDDWDGRHGWVRRDRLGDWSVAASPGLRCLPARMRDGTLGFAYAHPGWGRGRDRRPCGAAAPCAGARPVRAIT